MNSSERGPLQSLTVKPQQKLLATLALQQALQVLQMPILELSNWVQTQIEQNPLLEWTDQNNLPEEERTSDPGEYTISGKTNKSPLPDKILEIQQPISLYEHLMNQAQHAFTTQVEIDFAEKIIGNLDERGFFSSSLETLSDNLLPEHQERILHIIQEFDPPGIGSCSLQESLLTQLRAQGKTKELAYAIVEQCFEDLIHNRIPSIQKKLGHSETNIQEAIKQEISVLDPFPGYRFRPIANMPLVPDIFVSSDEEGKWKVEVNDSLLPSYRYVSQYHEALFTNERDRRFIRKHMTSAKWLDRTIQKRNQTLRSITEYLMKAQPHFFTGHHEKIDPLSIKEVSEALGLHESTVARAVSQKYLSCPMGIFSLRKFFSQPVNKNSQNISCDTAKKTLRRLIDSENKKHPMSDQQLLEKMRKMGIPCARRTVTKYRKSLHIPSRKFRKIW